MKKEEENFHGINRRTLSYLFLETVSSSLGFVGVIIMLCGIFWCVLVF